MQISDNVKSNQIHKVRWQHC